MPGGRERVRHSSRRLRCELEPRSRIVLKSDAGERRDDASLRRHVRRRRARDRELEGQVGG